MYSGCSANVEHDLEELAARVSMAHGCTAVATLDRRSEGETGSLPRISEIITDLIKKTITAFLVWSVRVLNLC
jgi:hypothetical protein